MSNALQEAKDLLAKVEGRYPFKFNQVSPPDSKEIIGTIRDVNGNTLVRPHEESMSMFVGTRDEIDFFINSAQVLANLVELVEINNTPSTEAAKPSDGPKNS